MVAAREIVVRAGSDKGRFSDKSSPQLQPGEIFHGAIQYHDPRNQIGNVFEGGNSMTVATDHYTQVVELFKDHFKDRPISGVEIGTGPAILTITLLSNFKNLGKLYTIDPWEHRDGSEYEAWFPQATLDESMRTAYERLAPFSDRVIIMPIRSDDAAPKLREERFDFVWIDGDHTLIQVERDILNYRPLVKLGGILGGHDYHIVSNLVKEIFGNRVHTGVDLTWWVFV
jgi:hypothetical protein